MGVGGDDVYRWGGGQGVNEVVDSVGSNTLQIAADASRDQIWLRQVDDDLEVSIIGTGDRLYVDGWYTSPANQLASLQLATGETLIASSVQQLVQAMASFDPPAAGQTTLPPDYQQQLNPVIAANWV